ncbi:MAG TPA: 3-deoxy-manno-octulosonate cytidylyltransferase [Dissulfurispiraceae bacterium]|nr:3-deoxy-manno-octulosonate cytidylyltransferase [Dissulfurispiraceae bacterium]
MPAIVVIPARYGASRFPGKPLTLIAGKPMIQHVYENARRAARVHGAYVATDDQRISSVVQAFGGNAVMTSAAHQSGTDRIAEAVKRISESGVPIGPNDVIVNVQGDEPLMQPAMIDQVIALMDDSNAAIGTLAKPIDDAASIYNPNIVKAVIARNGYALYFSRAPVPYHRDLFASGERGLSETVVRNVRMLRHVGIYAYRRAALEVFSLFDPSPLEAIEKLEQLRALENGLPIKVGITDIDTIGVDTPEDLERVELWLSTSS